MVMLENLFNKKSYSIANNARLGRRYYYMMSYQGINFQLIGMQELDSSTWALTKTNLNFPIFFKQTKEFLIWK